jgi:hypothetical protein
MSEQNEQDIQNQDSNREPESLVGTRRDDPFDFDIDAALASVASLSDVIAQQEAQEAADLAREEAELQAAEEAARRRSEHYFPHPPLMIMSRGKLASVVPALLLVGIGAWLTFAATTSTPPDTSIILAVVVGGVGISLIAEWLSSERWGRGSLFMGLALLLLGGVTFYLVNQFNPAEGWPLLIAAVGVAAGIAGGLAHPRDRQQMMAGMLGIGAGAAGMVVTMGMLSEDITNTAQTIGPPALLVLFVVALIPVILKRRR